MRYPIYLLLLSLSLLCGLEVQAQSVVHSYLRRAPLLAPEQQKAIGQLELTDSPQFPLEIDESLSLLSLDARSASLKTSQVSSWAMQLLALPNKTDLIVLIETVTVPTPDSHISLYSPSWELLPLGQIFVAPKAEDFLRGIDGDSPEGQRLAQLVEPLHTVYRFTQIGEIEVELMLPLSWEDKQNVKLRQLIDQLPRLRYHWDGIRFVRQ